VKNYSLTHLSNEALDRELPTKAAREKGATAELLAHIAEFDFRKLYLPAAYPSMLEYCIRELRLSEEAAKKRIRVARVGRECLGVFDALASGRVHLGGLVVLARTFRPGMQRSCWRLPRTRAGTRSSAWWRIGSRSFRFRPRSRRSRSVARQHVSKWVPRGT
jgi:hypothetical protein